MAASIKASSQGLIVADSTRKHRGWTKIDPRWVETANVSSATLKRFWKGTPISQDAFVAICETLGVDWQEITELGSGNLHRLLDEGVEAWNEWKRLNPPLGYNFDDADLRNADLRGIDFSYTSLMRANLNGANLENANLSRADLTNANLNGANLRGANLTATQALSTVFTGAILTGACLQDWNINRSTRFENTRSDYIYLQYVPNSSSQKYRERRPSSGNFASGEFTVLFQKALETVDLIFADGIDWTAFFQTFQQLRAQYGDDNLSIQAIERKSGDNFLIRLEIPQEVDKANIESHAKVLYQKQLQVLETMYKDKLATRELEIETYRQQNVDLLNIVKQLAERSINVRVETSTSPQTTAINFEDIHGTVNVESVSQNQYPTGINFGGDIHGTVNVELVSQNQYPTGINFGGDIHGTVNVESVSQNQNLAEVAEEFQAVIESFSSFHDSTSKHTLPETVQKEIQDNPTLQSRLVNALKAGGTEALKTIVGNSLTSIPLETVKGWIEESKRKSDD